VRSSVPFLRATTMPAQSEIEDAAQYLAANISAETAARFLDRLGEEMMHLGNVIFPVGLVVVFADFGNG
jgi:hypothetical protein